MRFPIVIEASILLAVHNCIPGIRVLPRSLSPVATSCRAHERTSRYTCRLHPLGAATLFLLHLNDAEDADLPSCAIPYVADARLELRASSAQLQEVVLQMHRWAYRANQPQSRHSAVTNESLVLFDSEFLIFLQS